LSFLSFLFLQTRALASHSPLTSLRFDFLSFFLFLALPLFPQDGPQEDPRARLEAPPARTHQAPGRAGPAAQDRAGEREKERERERERAGERGGKRKRKKNARGIDRGGRSIEKVKERNFRRFLLCFAGFFFFRGFVSGEMNTWSNDQTRRRKRGREDERMGATSDLPSPSPVVARSPGAHILDLKKNSKLQNRSSPTPTGCSSSRTTPGFRARSWS